MANVGIGLKPMLARRSSNKNSFPNRKLPSKLFLNRKTVKSQNEVPLGGME
jgi:hypothetical protein